MVVDVGLDELEEFYDRNRSHMSWYGSDENPEKLLKYRKQVEEIVQAISENYGVESGDYAGRCGEMLASRVREELEVPLGSPSEGHETPNFDRANSLLGE